jgi:predicted GH43/DUF377 family glycosyl hydrolase
MKWRKLGRVYAPAGRWPWAVTHAFPPTPLVRGEDELRIYVGCCDAHGVGRIGYVDVAVEDPTTVRRVSPRPVLDVGRAASFDDHGVVPISAIDVNGRLYLYYVGFQQGREVPYHQFTGLAVSDDGGESFVRVQDTPILDPSETESMHRTGAFVRQRHGRFQTWYVAGNEWTSVNGKLLPVYNVKYAESDDGIHWPPSGRAVFDFANDDEHVIGRPFVFERNGADRMFYSIRTRSKGYRIGFANSTGENQWARHDAQIGLDVSAHGWDSDTVSYASVVSIKDQTFMFYNGNGCGRTGFGCAVLEDW